MVTCWCQQKNKNGVQKTKDLGFFVKGFCASVIKKQGKSLKSKNKICLCRSIFVNLHIKVYFIFSVTEIYFNLLTQVCYEINVVVVVFSFSISLIVSLFDFCLQEFGFRQLCRLQMGGTIQNQEEEINHLAISNKHGLIFSVADTSG